MKINFDANGHLIDLVYQPASDFNSTDFPVGGNPVLDSFGFTIQDDGLLIDPDGGPDIQTTPTGISSTASIFVASVNDVPTLDVLADVNIVEDAGLQTVDLSGISPGGGEPQALRITATSSDTTLFADPQVSFVAGSPTGSITFSPLDDRYGDATITVTVEDAGLDNDLSTTSDNLSVTQVFLVTVAPVNDVLSTTAKSFNTTEDASLRITAGQLTANSLGDADPLTSAPQDESNQTFQITEIIDADGTPVTSTNASVPFATPQGLITEINFDANGHLIDLVYEPADDFNSTEFPVNGNPVLDSFGFTIQDDGLLIDPDGGPDIQTAPTSVSSTASIFVASVNDAPTLDVLANLNIVEDAGQQTVDLTGISAGGGESQALRITAAANDTTLFDGPQQISFVAGSPIGTLTFTTFVDRFGDATITVTVEDAGPDNDFSTASDNLSVSRDFIVTIEPVNDAPSTTAKAFTTSEETAITITAEELIQDSLGDEFSLAAPPQDESNQTVRVIAIDASGTSVTSSNLAATVFPVSTPNGQINSIVFDAAGQLVELEYQPATDFNSGSDLENPILDTFGFELQDDGLIIPADGGPAIQTPPESFDGVVSITVLSVNDAPTLSDLLDLTISENSELQSITLSGITAGGGESQALRVTATSSDPSLILDPTVIYSSPDATGELQFTPTANQFGSSVITVVVEDAGADGDLIAAADNSTFSESFTVTVSAVNNPPTLDPISNQTTPEDSSSQTVNLSGITAGVDENEPLQIIATSDNPDLFSNFTVSYTSPASTGSILYTPAPDQFGSTTITVTVADGGFDSDLTTTEDNATSTQTFDITITNVPDSPVAFDDEFNADEDTVLDITAASLLSNDADADLRPGSDEVLTVSVTDGLTQQGAAVSFDPVSGIITYDPTGSEILQALAPGEILQDSFVYSLSDADGETNPPTASVILNVTGVNDAPILRDDLILTADNSASLVVLPLTNDEDVDGTLDLQSFVITQAPTLGTLDQQVDASGDLALVFTPSEGFAGNDTFVYTVSDNLGQSGIPATVTIQPDPTPRTGNDIGGGVAVDGIRVDVLANDVAVSGQLDPDTLTIIAQPTNGTATVEDDNTISYTPIAGFIGSDSFTYTVADTNGNISDPVTVTVNSVASGLNNPISPFDVNASGEVTAMDALLVINRIGQSGSSSIPVGADERGPNFFDVNDSLTISSLDALLVINSITSNLSPPEPESEFVQTFPLIVDRSVDSSTTDEDLIESTESVSIATTSETSKLRDSIAVDASLIDDEVVGLLANDSSESESDEELLETLTDLVLAGF